MQRQLALAESRANQAQEALAALQAERNPDGKPRRHQAVSFKPIVLFEASSQGPVLRNALGHLGRQGKVIEDSLEQDEAMGQGVSAETQALLAGYQAQGADLEQQVQQYSSTFCGQHATFASKLASFGCHSAHPCNWAIAGTDAGKLDNAGALLDQLADLEGQGQQLQARANAMRKPTTRTVSTSSASEVLPST